MVERIRTRWRRRTSTGVARAASAGSPACSLPASATRCWQPAATASAPRSCWASGRAVPRPRRRPGGDVRQRRAHHRRAAGVLPGRDHLRQGRPGAGRRAGRGRRGRLPAGRLRAARRRDGGAPRHDGGRRFRHGRVLRRRLRAAGDDRRRAAPPSRRRGHRAGLQRPALERLLADPPAARARRGRRSTTRRPSLGGRSVADALLEPTRIYAERGADAGRQRSTSARWPTSPAAASPATWPGRCPPALGMRIDLSSWERPAVFGWLASLGVEEDEMRRVFNLGVGYVAVVRRGRRPSWPLRALTEAGETGVGRRRAGRGRRGGAALKAGVLISGSGRTFRR